MNLGGQAVETVHASNCDAGGKEGKASAAPPARPKAEVRHRQGEERGGER